MLEHCKKTLSPILNCKKNRCNNKKINKLNKIKKNKFNLSF